MKTKTNSLISHHTGEIVVTLDLASLDVVRGAAATPAGWRWMVEQAGRLAPNTAGKYSKMDPANVTAETGVQMAREVMRESGVHPGAISGGWLNPDPIRRPTGRAGR
jgi:hypothetical protein